MRLQKRGCPEVITMRLRAARFANLCSFNFAITLDAAPLVEEAAAEEEGQSVVLFCPLCFWWRLALPLGAVSDAT